MRTSQMIAEKYANMLNSAWKKRTSTLKQIVTAYSQKISIAHCILMEL